MAQQGILPRYLRSVPTPACAACMFAKAQKRPWRSKTSKMGVPTKARTPGECVSVDQLVSPTPGLIAQMTGFKTTKQYKYATIYVDQATKLGFMHLQKTQSAEETVQGKEAFETYARNMVLLYKHTMETMVFSKLTFGLHIVKNDNKT